MTTYFSYLSDTISITYTLADTAVNHNIPYRVDIKPSCIRDGNYRTVYQGSVYYTGTANLYLNDIIESNIDDFTWFKELSLPVLDTNSSFVRGTLVDVRVVFDVFGTATTYTVKNIINSYLNPCMEHESAFDFYGEDVCLKSAVGYGYNVTPRIPYSTKQWDDDGTDMMSFSFPCKFFINELVGQTEIFINNPNGDKYRSFAIRTNDTPTSGCNIKQHNLIGDVTGEGYYVTAEALGDVVRLADIDYEPAEYYLMWINRHGAVQCQPFCKKNTLSENVSTSYINTMINESVPSNKTVEYSWTLNSHWLNYAEHGEFESLLISKYVWLYDSVRGWFHLVNVADSKWTYKDHKNTKKPFNLTVNLKAAKQQNINY